MLIGIGLIFPVVVGYNLYPYYICPRQSAKATLKKPPFSPTA
jgi:hypothetical protein